jgi:hypothetical protein
MDEEKNQETRKTGEKGFSIFLLLVGLFFTWQSWKLYQQSPGASSYGAVPLACSVLIVLFSLAILISDWRKKSPISGKKLLEKIKEGFRSILPLDVVVLIGMGILYCGALYLNIGFLLATPIFLWCSMTYLSRGGYLKNLLWTALCMGFIYLVFKVLFSVVLP